MPFTGYPGTNPLSIAVPGCGGNGSLGVQSTDCAINLIQTAVVTLTSAQILTLNTTPVVIVPAPGAGLTIIGDYMVLKYLNGGTNYAGGGAFSMQYSGGATLFATLPASTITGASATATAPTTGAVTGSINTAVTITNATGNFTTGNGTIVILMSYVIV